ncbi:unnamed protein product [Allacma fusca]|uniref:Uncharacterized protein n=1 Tax=Allacma fusca TaxID=39272 RepID=A0A8J2LJJ3_9HEXA|nr:unnamed protein product [Allacma fusca]
MDSESNTLVPAVFKYLHKYYQDFIVEDEEVRGLVRGQIVPHPRPTRRSSSLGVDSLFRGRVHQFPIAEAEAEEEEEEEEEDQDLEEEVAEEQRLAAVTSWSGPNSPHNSSQSRREDVHHYHNLPHRHHLHPSLSPRSDPEESSSDIGMSLSMSDRLPNPSTASLLDSMERRTQRTYRYGIGLVCVGATLNWLGFAQVRDILQSEHILNSDYNTSHQVPCPPLEKSA